MHLRRAKNDLVVVQHTKITRRGVRRCASGPSNVEKHDRPSVHQSGNLGKARQDTMTALQLDEYSEGNDLLFMFMLYSCNMLQHKVVLRKAGLWSQALIIALAQFFCTVLALQPSWHATAEVEEPACSTSIALSLSLEHNLGILKVFFLLLTFMALVSFI